MIALVCALMFACLGDPEQAERAYHDGQFARAEALYTELLDDPTIAPGPVLYNLGNCAYRRGEFARAMVYYGRARLHLGDRVRLLANIALAERQLGVERATAPLAALPVAWVDRMSAVQASALIAALQCLGLAGFVGMRGRGARITMLAVVALGLTIAARRAYTQFAPPPLHGIVLPTEITLRTEPHAELPAALRLRAGERVRVAERSDRWMRVEHDDGTGWIERDAIGVIE